jgi:hypothetical protein
VFVISEFSGKSDISAQELNFGLKSWIFCGGAFGAADFESGIQFYQKYSARGE